MMGTTRQCRIACSWASSSRVVSSQFDATVEALRCRDSLRLDTVNAQLIAANERVRSAHVHESTPNGRAFYSADKKGQRGARGEGNPRRRDDRRRCHNCHKVGHISANCPDKKQTDSGERHAVQSGTALVTNVLQSSAVHNPSSVHNIFIDTGTSHHIVTDKSFFVKVHEAPVTTVTC